MRKSALLRSISDLSRPASRQASWDGGLEVFFCPDGVISSERGCRSDEGTFPSESESESESESAIFCLVFAIASDGKLLSDGMAVCHRFAAPRFPASDRFSDKSPGVTTCWVATLDTRYTPAASSRSNLERIGPACSAKYPSLGALASRHNLPLARGRQPRGTLMALAMMRRRYHNSCSGSSD